MKIWECVNCCWNPNPTGIEDDMVFIDCQFAQFSPKTDVFKGASGLKFMGKCNLINCIIPPDAEVDSLCNVAEVEYELLEAP